MASMAIAPLPAMPFITQVLFIFLLIRLGLLLFEEKIYNKNNGQDCRQYHAYDYPCRAAYMQLIVKFSDQGAVGQKTCGKNNGHDELDSFKHNGTSW
jgi:hypothetical protein